jgi:pyruvate-formate lyase-activating enzyme
MEALDDLAKSKVLSQPNIKQMLKLLQDFPAEAEKIVKFLKGLRNGQPLDLVAFIEGHYNGHPLPSQEEARAVPPSDLQNDGTMELEDIFNGED